MIAASLFPDLDGYWLPSHQADPRAIALYLRHYSAKRYRDNRARRQFCAPGEKMVLLTADCTALFVWHHPLMARPSGEVGVCCTVFRNEGPIRSSDLIREACALAWRRWPGERLYTYVWDAKVATSMQRGRNAVGWCYRKAGWRPCGRNSDGRLTILEMLPEWQEVPDGHD